MGGRSRPKLLKLIVKAIPLPDKATFSREKDTRTFLNHDLKKWCLARRIEKTIRILLSKVGERLASAA